VSGFSRTRAMAPKDPWSGSKAGHYVRMKSALVDRADAKAKEFEARNR